jgi:fucose 4-O-acetylase-like acetyltransferase
MADGGVPSPTPTTDKESRDAYLDNCKCALMLLIGVGHALQWLLAVEDGRAGRGWCGTDGDGGDVGNNNGGEGGDNFDDVGGNGNNSQAFDTFVASSLSSSSLSSSYASWAVTPLRALYTWSNAIAIPMFCVISGHLSRGLVAASQHSGELLNRMRRNAESLMAPFLLFQALACAVEAASPALRDALAPGVGGGGGGGGDSSAATRAAAEAAASLDLWTPHISWYLVALALWRGVLPVFAQMRPTAAAALAAAVGVGVGFTNTGAATGYFLKWGTVWGNFPYFALGTVLTEHHYRAARDVGAAGRVAACAVTLAAMLSLWWGLSQGAVCFDAWWGCIS